MLVHLIFTLCCSNTECLQQEIIQSRVAAHDVQLRKTQNRNIQLVVNLKTVTCEHCCSHCCTVQIWKRNDVVGRQISGFFSVHEPTGTAETDTGASGDIKKKGFTSVLHVTKVQSQIFKLLQFYLHLMLLGPSHQPSPREQRHPCLHSCLQFSCAACSSQGRSPTPASLLNFQRQPQFHF